jgi:hypothetical protein
MMMNLFLHTYYIALIIIKWLYTAKLIVMRKYSMIEVYSDLFKCSDFILEQVIACNEDVFSLAAKRVLLIRSL